MNKFYVQSKKKKKKENVFNTMSVAIQKVENAVEVDNIFSYLDFGEIFQV